MPWAALLLLALALPAFGAGRRAPSSVPIVSLTPSVTPSLSAPYPLSTTADTYRAAYLYSLACLARQAGDSATAARLLEQAQASDPASALLLRERGEALEDSGQDAAAAESLSQALRARPEDRELRRRLARVYQRQGRWEEARALFLGPGGSEPADAASLRALVGLDLAEGKPAAARSRLRALLARGGDGDDRELLALLLRREGFLQEAALEYSRALAREAGREESWSGLALCEAALGRPAGARCVLQEGLALLPESLPLLRQLANLLYAARDYGGAEPLLGRLLKAEPRDARSLMLRGLCRLGLGLFGAAQEDLEALGELEPDDPAQARALGLALQMQGRGTEAETQLRRALKLDASAPEAWGQLASLLAEQGRKAEAEVLLGEGLRALPQAEVLHRTLAGLREEAGDAEGAAAALRRGLEAGAGAGLRLPLAALLHRQGRPAEAEAELEILLGEQPRNAEALNFLGYSLAERGQRLPEAERFLRRALAEEAENPAYLDSLGWVLHRLGRRREALLALEKAERIWSQPHGADILTLYEHLQAVEKALGHAGRARGWARKAREFKASLGASAPAAAPGKGRP